MPRNPRNPPISSSLGKVFDSPDPPHACAGGYQPIYQLIHSISTAHCTTRLVGQLASGYYRLSPHRSLQDEALPSDNDYATFPRVFARGLGPGESSPRKRTGVGMWGWESTLNYLEWRRMYHRGSCMTELDALFDFGEDRRSV